jgi:type IV secretion system protein VirB10
MNEPLPRDDADPTLSPLPGEPGIPDVAAPPKGRWSRKGLLSVALLGLALAGLAALTVHRWTAGKPAGGSDESRRAGDRPAVASAEPRRLEMPTLPASAAAPQARPQETSPRIPALVATEEEIAEPIGVRRSGAGSRSTSSRKLIAPEDAPAMLVTTRPGTGPRRGTATELDRETQHDADPSDPSDPTDPTNPLARTSRNLQAYQQQLRGLLDSLGRSTALATGQGTAPTPDPASGRLPLGALLGGPSGDGPQPGAVTAAAAAAGSLLGSPGQGSATPRVAASHLGNRSLTLPKGTAFTCALKTRVISAVSGQVGCQVQRNVFSDDGRVLLIERGSHLDGEYRIGSVRPGMVRIPVVWTRLRTPLGVTVDLESPGTGPLGEAGIDGHVDNRWGERVGAAMLLSLIDDTVKLVVQNQATRSEGDTIVLPSTTGSTSQLAEKVLDSTINIPPLIYQNQGGIVGIYVTRDVDFSSVYALEPTASTPPREGAP